MGLQPKIQDFDVQSKFSNGRRPAQRMVYCGDVATYSCPINVVEYRISERGSVTGYEIRSLSGWRNWCMNDANLVTTFQPYIETS